ncbi:pilus assembly PilX family protein [Hydrogenophaga sp. BPS33]|uniref:pilus assembly PilX family protein n=1 Tax=Hydrogenophaga sp. BPS33 TaxID=2651974 RepID=UPI001359495B|nr:PilX N-terminal domain-containing pilus assembly protein [Hydrogenophaga sp. BPS33]
MKQQHLQQGFVLVTSLIFLIVLSLLGVMALRGTLFGERMTANSQDLFSAREFAELALRDAERDILGLRFDGTTYCRTTSTTVCATARPENTRPKEGANDEAPFWLASSPEIDDVALENGGLNADVSVQGVYTAGSAAACGMPVWSGADWQDNANPARSCAGTIGAAVPTIAYGTFTDAPFNGPNGTVRPRYIIEMFKADELNISPSSNKIFFRITAVGFGRTQGVAGRTSVTLQSVFSPN